MLQGSQSNTIMYSHPHYVRTVVYKLRVQITLGVTKCKGLPFYMNANIAVGWDRSGDLRITRKAS